MLTDIYCIYHSDQPNHHSLIYIRTMPLTHTNISSTAVSNVAHS